MVLLSALRVTGHPPADASGRRGGGARRAAERPDDPRVDGNALAGGGKLDVELERLAQAQRDACARCVVAGRRRCSGLGLVLDVDERGLLTCQPDLDMAGRELRRDLERGLAEQVEEPKAGGSPEGLAQPLGCVRDGLVAERGHRFQVGEQRIDVRCRLHDDIIVTSFVLPVKCQLAGKSAPYACRYTFFVLSTPFT